MITSDSEGEDLKWLFSRTDEYTPSRLTGEPLPAPLLPERGEGSARHWDPRWRKFGIGNQILLGVGYAGAALSAAIRPHPPRWRTQNALDEWGRRTLGIQRYDRALWARDVSDFLVSVNLVYPLLIDSLIIMAWYRQSEEVATQMALITLESVAVAGMVQGLTSALTSRERPFVRDCGKTIDERLDDCHASNRYRSFFSGHTSNAFAAASVTCTHHVRHRVFGDTVADGLACGAAFASASTVGLMRVMGQRHYVSDVLVGAAIGTMSGLGIPWLLHYRLSEDTSRTTTPATSLTLLPLPNGISVGGTF